MILYLVESRIRSTPVRATTPVKARGVVILYYTPGAWRNRRGIPFWEISVSIADVGHLFCRASSQSYLGFRASTEDLLEGLVPA